MQIVFSVETKGIVTEMLVVGVDLVFGLRDEDFLLLEFPGFFKGVQILFTKLSMLPSINPLSRRIPPKKVRKILLKPSQLFLFSQFFNSFMLFLCQHFFLIPETFSWLIFLLEIVNCIIRQWYFFLNCYLLLLLLNDHFLVLRLFPFYSKSKYSNNFLLNLSIAFSRYFLAFSILTIDLLIKVPGELP